MSHDLDLACIQTIRTLSMDAVQQASSGHPGTPMALAPVAYSIWQDALRYDPRDPSWPDRDRFVLSCGHASMLLYSLLHLCDVRALDERGRPTGAPAVTLDELRRFRQLGSKTPGHPEHGHTSGVETTTGPLGQGVANSVGMALARRWLAARYDRPGHELFTFRVFALCSDGDLMEGISAEAASFAGYQRLAGLCWLWDDNGITIDGRTDLTFGEDVAARFASYGWNVLRIADANDLGALRAALASFAAERERPTFIAVKSTIGFGSPNRADSSKAHGEPLGEDEVRATKRVYGWPEDAHFLVPEGVQQRFAEQVGRRGGELHRAWQAAFERYRAAFPEAARELEQIRAGELPEAWDGGLPSFPADEKGLATRAASGKALNALAARVPWLIGGSADLEPSNKTWIGPAGTSRMSAAEPAGRNLHFGVREHAMASIANGMALCGLRPFVGTFLIFSDYMRPAQRLAALMRLPVTYVMTHDSIGVGEDGPTHQPIEQLAALRALPGLLVIRPGDANETAEAWRVALASRREPVLLALTRQNLPVLDRARLAPAAGLARGAYVLSEAPRGGAQVVLIGTGSEVALCLAAQKELGAQGIAARVVSMPCWELFERQSASYRESVLPGAIVARVAVEMASGFGWERWVGERGQVICMRGFGASAPLEDLLVHFGFTVDAVVKAAKEQLSLATA